jgi:hypothetical protein
MQNQCIFRTGKFSAKKNFLLDFPIGNAAEISLPTGSTVSGIIRDCYVKRWVVKENLYAIKVGRYTQYTMLTPLYNPWKHAKKGFWTNPSHGAFYHLWIQKRHVFKMFFDLLPFYGNWALGALKVKNKSTMFKNWQKTQFY